MSKLILYPRWTWASEKNEFYTCYGSVHFDCIGFEKDKDIWVKQKKHAFERPLVVTLKTPFSEPTENVHVISEAVTFASAQETEKVQVVSMTPEEMTQLFVQRQQEAKILQAERLEKEAELKRQNHIQVPPGTKVFRLDD
jgi:hypothetical protein